MKILQFIVLYFLCSGSVSALTVFEVDAESGNSYSLSHYPAQGTALLLWLPSEFGLGNGYQSFAQDLADKGINLWVLDLHESLMVPPGRGSLDKISLLDMLQIVHAARDRGFTEVYLSGASRGAKLALEMGYQWQIAQPKDDFIKGLILFSPQLVEGRTVPGVRPQMVDISGYSNLPVYLIQPEYSTKYAHRRQILEQLKSGGSPVFAHYLSAVQDGFQSRSKGDLTARDLQTRDALAQILRDAVTLLRGSAPAPFKPMQGAAQSEEDAPPELAQKRFELHPHVGDPAPPPLILPDMTATMVDLTQLKGTVVLVNFWATWCGPCVREIPSISRLVKKLEGKPFRVLAININEPKSEIRRFLEQFNVNFDILLDTDGQVVRDWNVYAYPSNFVIDRTGAIRYVYRGALEWDDSDIVNVIESMF